MSCGPIPPLSPEVRARRNEWLRSLVDNPKVSEAGRRIAQRELDYQKCDWGKCKNTTTHIYSRGIEVAHTCDDHQLWGWTEQG